MTVGTGIEILEVVDSAEKGRLAAAVLTDLPEWFGIPSAVAEYVAGVADMVFFAAYSGDQLCGFFAGQIHFGHVGELYVLGVVKSRQGEGVGRRLYQRLEAAFLAAGCDCLVVKTLSASHPSPEYAATRAFYRALGFAELIELPDLWGPANPCLLMEKRLG